MSTIRPTAASRTPKIFMEVLRSKGWNSDDAPALDDPQQHDEDGEDEQQVDEPAHGVRRHQPENPQHDQDDGDGPEHDSSFSRRGRGRMTTQGSSQEG